MARLVGYPRNDDTPRHGSLRADMVYMAEVTLATVEHLDGLKGKIKAEFERQKRLAKFAVSSCIFHGVEDEPHHQKCGRVKNIIDAYYKTGTLRMPWEKDDG